jgi:hypothetical protein
MSVSRRKPAPACLYCGSKLKKYANYTYPDTVSTANGNRLETSDEIIARLGLKPSQIITKENGYVVWRGDDYGMYGDDCFCGRWCQSRYAQREAPPAGSVRYRVEVVLKPGAGNTRPVEVMFVEAVRVLQYAPVTTPGRPYIVSDDKDCQIRVQVDDRRPEKYLP